MTFWVNGTGDPCVTYKVGADTVSKKLGSDAILPVSYTHLDVYKRQMYTCWMRMGSQWHAPSMKTVWMRII